MEEGVLQEFEKELEQWITEGILLLMMTTAHTYVIFRIEVCSKCHAGYTTFVYKPCDTQPYSQYMGWG